MRNIVLHYYYDPLCGWCYGAEPLVKAAAAKAPIELHGGGLWDQPGGVPIKTRAQNKVHDRRIHVLTGQVFGAANSLPSAPRRCARPRSRSHAKSDAREGRPSA